MKVKDLIAKLQRCDPNAEIAVLDTDPGWALPDLEVWKLQACGTIVLAGQYTEVTDVDISAGRYEVVL